MTQLLQDTIRAYSLLFLDKYNVSATFFRFSLNRPCVNNHPFRVSYIDIQALSLLTVIKA